jgi:hypothetical protein
MEKNSKYALIALSVLIVGVIFVGVLVRNSTLSIQASSQVPSEVIPDLSIPLKEGANYFTNGPKSITLESRIIGISGSLISIADAKQRGIVDYAARENDGKILGEGISKINPGEKFIVGVKDISLSPAVYLEGI